MDELVHPVEFRYRTPEMSSIWSQGARLKIILELELALSKVEAELGIIPEQSPLQIQAAIQRVSLDRVIQLERELGHEMMAIVKAIAEQAGDAGKWVHYGATSSDILDTLLGIQMKRSLELIRSRLISILDQLIKLSERYRDLICCSRTHGQIANPTTYGLRFAIWAEEMGRHLERLDQLLPRIARGKFSGAVGTYASLGEMGLEVESRLMKQLGLIPDMGSTQIIQRDIHAEYLFFLGNLASSLEKFCTEIRTLQRTEISELEEPFSESQVGSSAMPHKRNPVMSEQICGISRVIRGAVQEALQNNLLWDERDLTNSSCERIILPQSSILTDYILVKFLEILKGLKLHPERIEANLERLRGLNLSEALMMHLAPKMGRQAAYDLVRSWCMEAYAKDLPLRDVVLRSGLMDASELDRILDPCNYLGAAHSKREMILSSLKSRFPELNSSNQLPGIN